MENEQKIKDSKGNIYDSCPYIDKIISTINDQLSFYNDELIKISIKSNLEIIRKINRELRHLKDETNIRTKYDIVNMHLNIDSEDLKHVEYASKDIADKLKRLENLEEENEELKWELQQINNLTRN